PGRGAHRRAERRARHERADRPGPQAGGAGGAGRGPRGPGAAARKRRLGGRRLDRAAHQGLFVAIAGMVKKPGRYPWQQGMTLRELVTLARGPTVGAYLKEAEIGRLPADRSQGQLTQTVRAPIDSTYLFERDAAGRYIGPPGLAFPGPGAPEVPLQPYANVLILRQPDFALPRTVYL